MKTFFLFVLLFLLVCQSDGQILKRLGRHAKETAEWKVEQKINQKVSQGIDSVFEASKKIAKKKKDTKSDVKTNFLYHVCFTISLYSF